MCKIFALKAAKLWEQSSLGGTSLVEPDRFKKKWRNHRDWAVTLESLFFYGSCAPSERYRIYIYIGLPHLIRVIIRSFQISYFSTDLLMFFSCSSFDLSVLMRRVQWNLVVDPLRGIFVLLPFLWTYLIIFQDLTVSLIASLLQSTLTHRGTGHNRHYSSEPKVRRTFFRAIPQSIE